MRPRNISLYLDGGGGGPGRRRERGQLPNPVLNPRIKCNWLKRDAQDDLCSSGRVLKMISPSISFQWQRMGCKSSDLQGGGGLAGHRWKGEFAERDDEKLTRMEHTLLRVSPGQWGRLKPHSWEMAEGGCEPRLPEDDAHALSTTTPRFAQALSKCSHWTPSHTQTGCLVQETAAHGIQESCQAKSETRPCSKHWNKARATVGEIMEQLLCGVAAVDQRLCTSTPNPHKNLQGRDCHLRMGAEEREP